MPAILRNSLPNLLPSQSIIGSYAVVGAIAAGLGVRVAGPHRVYGSQDYAMWDGVLEVEPV